MTLSVYATGPVLSVALSVTETLSVNVPVALGVPLINSVLPPLLVKARPSAFAGVAGVLLVGICVPFTEKT